jgi:hypothetical protein
MIDTPPPPRANHSRSSIFADITNTVFAKVREFSQSLIGSNPYAIVIMQHKSAHPARNVSIQENVSTKSYDPMLDNSSSDKTDLFLRSLIRIQSEQLIKRLNEASKVSNLPDSKSLGIFDQLNKADKNIGAPKTTTLMIEAIAAAFTTTEGSLLHRLQESFQRIENENKKIVDVTKDEFEEMVFVTILERENEFEYETLKDIYGPLRAQKHIANKLEKEATGWRGLAKKKEYRQASPTLPRDVRNAPEKWTLISLLKNEEWGDPKKEYSLTLTNWTEEELGLIKQIIQELSMDPVLNDQYNAIMGGNFPTSYHLKSSKRSRSN